MSNNNQQELFAKLWQVHFKIEAFYDQMPTLELKQAIDRLCISIEYLYCLNNPSIAESSLIAELSEEH